MPNIFYMSVGHLHFYLGSLPIFRLGCLYLMWICMSALHIRDINPLSDGALRYALSFSRLPFHLVMNFFHGPLFCVFMIVTLNFLKIICMQLVMVASWSFICNIFPILPSSLCLFLCVRYVVWFFSDFVVVVLLYRRNLYGDWQHLSLWPPELCTPGVPPGLGEPLLFMMRPDAVGMPVGGAGLWPKPLLPGLPHAVDAGPLVQGGWVSLPWGS